MTFQRAIETMSLFHPAATEREDSKNVCACLFFDSSSCVYLIKKKNVRDEN